MIGILTGMRYGITAFGCLFLLVIAPPDLHAQTPRIQSQGAAAAGMGMPIRLKPKIHPPSITIRRE